MNSDEFGQVLRREREREREPGAVVKVRYCRSDPELDTFHSIIHSKTKIWSKMWDPWNMLTIGLGPYLIFVTDTTDGVCVKKIARCKFLQI